MSVTVSYPALMGAIDFETATDEEMEAHFDLQVNMHNGNAALVFSALGIDLAAEGYPGYGELPVEDFLGRVLMALAISPVDEGMPGHKLVPGDDAGIFGTVREGGASFYQGARRPGYLQAQLAELHALVERAIAAGDTVIHWG